MKHAITQYKQLIEEQKFFEAHEVFEALWFEKRLNKTPHILLLKGFINAAVSLELYKKKRYSNSKKVWRTYLKYRQYLFYIDTPYKNDLYQLSRFIESFYTKKSQLIH